MKAYWALCPANKKKSSGRKASKRASSAKKSLATMRTPAKKRVAPLSGYKTILTDVVCLLEEARRAAARSVNAVITATYWLVGQRIIEQEQSGKAHAV